MRQAGASALKLSEYPSAMNCRPLQFFRYILNSVNGLYAYILSESDWKGVVDLKNLDHPNFEAALKKGYGEAELMTRGLRYVLRKRVRSLRSGQNA